MKSFLLVMVVLSIGCSDKRSGGAPSPSATAERPLDLDIAALAKLEKPAACRQIYRALHGCREVINRRMAASQALDLGPDDAVALAWSNQPLDATASAGLCTDSGYAERIVEQAVSCSAATCSELADCLMPGRGALEVACPDGTLAMANVRQERTLMWCVRPDGQPHGPMVGSQQGVVILRGRFRDGQRHGLFHWPQSDTSVRYEQGEPVEVNGSPVSQLNADVKSTVRLLAMNVVGPAELLAKGPVSVRPLEPLAGEDAFVTCSKALAERDPFPDGQIRAELTINPDRKADQIEVQAPDEQVAACWRQQLQSFSFEGDWSEQAGDDTAVRVRAVWAIRSRPPAAGEAPVVAPEPPAEVDAGATSSDAGSAP